MAATDFLLGTIAMKHNFFDSLSPLSLVARASAFPLAMQVGAGCLFVVLVLWKPLAWLGIPADRLHHYLGALGPKGREAYLRMNSLDFILIMATYTISLGALLYRMCQLAGLSTNISLMFPFIMFCDIIETSVLRHATKNFPSPPNHLLLTAGSIANQIKLITFILGLVALIILRVRNMYGFWMLKEVKSK